MTARLVIVTLGMAVDLVLIRTVLSTDQISTGQVRWSLIISAGVAFSS